MIASKLSSTFVGNPRYPAGSPHDVFIKYNIINHKNQLIRTETRPAAVCFDITYKMSEDGQKVEEVNVDFDHNTMTPGEWYKVPILNEVRGFMIHKTNGELLQVKYSNE